MKRLSTFFALILAATSLTATAGDVVTGQYEYMNACATCHGENGRGGGELAQAFGVDVPDLTTMNLENDGEFPFLDTLMMIDGRTGIREHGGAMPVWGDRFEAAALEQVGVYGAELVVRGRLLSLVLYLETIQQD